MPGPMLQRARHPCATACASCQPSPHSHDSPGLRSFATHGFNGVSARTLNREPGASRNLGESDWKGHLDPAA
jgi:hypothetical protein